MKILFISRLYPSQPLDSGERITLALHKLVNHMQQMGCEILVVRPVYIYLREIFSDMFTKKALRFRERVLEIDNVKIIVFPIFKIPRIAYFYKPLYRFLDKYLASSGFKPDVVAAHFDKCLHIGKQYAGRKRLPFVAGIHIAPDLMAENPAAFSKRCGGILEAADVIACRSRYIHDKLCRWFPAYRDKCFTAFSGIDETLIEPAVFGIKKMNRWKEGKRISIVSACTLIERKKIHINLEALALLPGRIDWEYTIIGDGEERSFLETLTHQLRIGDRVHFAGVQPHDRVIEIMKQAHIFVLVSYLETFGLVYLEAMAAGNIVIGSRGEGIDGIIEHGKNGFLSPAGELEPLKNLLEKIILKSTAAELENILLNSRYTIKQYTDRKAAQNYLNSLAAIETHPARFAGTPLKRGIILGTNVKR